MTSSRARDVVGALAAILAFAAPSPAQISPPDLLDRIERVESRLVPQYTVRGEPLPTLTIEQRLEFYGVPGVSVAVINEGRLEWARGWGFVEAGSLVPVDTGTLFQAASISKPVAGVAALRLVEEGLLDLDEDVNLRLRSWKVPENGYTRTQKVTLRRLLSHSAGTTVHGFPGYSSGAALPTLAQLLDGTAPANTPPVRVGSVPGSQHRYSGGGVSIAQLLMMDVTGLPFEELAERYVLRPGGMVHSTFAQPLPPGHTNRAATGHRTGGISVSGRHHTYPEQAAAGLWTTPSDLARLAIRLQRVGLEAPAGILSPGSAREMLTRQSGDYGLGFGLSEEGGDLWFEHGGANAGFRAYLTVSATSGKGAVVMTNADGGLPLVLEIIRAIAREYDWPNFKPVERDATVLSRSTLETLAGSYHLLGPDRRTRAILDLRLEDDALVASLPSAGWNGRALRPASDSRFFFLESSGEIVFERDARGVVHAAVLVGFGEPVRAVRR